MGSRPSLHRSLGLADPTARSRSGLVTKAGSIIVGLCAPTGWWVADPTRRPLGIFDSGLGGLTVVRAIREVLPDEQLVYLGDTARVPYGTRSAHTVVRYARACAGQLMEHDIKALVVACNTVSAVALDVLRIELDLPVIGVIGPGARAGVAASEEGRVGVLATHGTARSGAYVRAAASVSSRVEVVVVAAPLLVPLVEEGVVEGDLARLAVRRYLGPLVDANIDTLVLGCTHFPLLAQVVTDELVTLAGRPVPVVNSAQATASEVRAFLQSRELAGAGPGGLRLLVTDRPESFEELAARFLGEPLDGIVVDGVDL